MSSLARLAEFIYIFNKYREIAEKSIRDYLEYFATKKPISPETREIDRFVKWYQTDSNTRIRYMTLQQEIDIAIDKAETRAAEAEARADEANARANEANARADEANARIAEVEARANEMEKKLREHGLL
ncbi:hypothetical protein SAMN05720781_0467 [Fibrobacter sp. UWT3]|uniref:hypothetical protein n=1 Tax=Fibrobacter sp. UWT3 TaxID=1896225 RepID=UPI000BD632DA|nr:hypothetical protein [Fibrobacter sp. UWT3]SOE51985.1 hypothetical protein SAMN05720781_0467 [Fibrobacter sp. UWT3]